MGKSIVLCYECHEELVHNPVFLPDDFADLALLVKLRGLQEEEKTDDRGKLGGRIHLLHEVIASGLGTLLSDEVGDLSMKAHNPGAAPDA
jgi:hypothetical protein